MEGLVEWEVKLQQKFGTHVNIIAGRKGGKVEFQYFGQDDLEPRDQEPGGDAFRRVGSGGGTAESRSGANPGGAGGCHADSFPGPFDQHAYEEFG